MPAQSPFQAALAVLAAKRTLPSALSSAELRDRLSAQIREQALFSARTTSADYLESVREALRKMLTGSTGPGDSTDLASVRADLLKVAIGLGYDPLQGGFPDRPVAPLAEPGSLSDISSKSRMDLVLETNYRTSAGRAYRAAGLDPARAQTFPAWELVRIYTRTVERGSTPKTIGWERRWMKAGGKLLTGGRMVALKTEEVWSRLGSVESDGLENPYPPFAFRSGMGLKEIDRKEAVRLGLLTPAESLPDTSKLSEEEGAGLKFEAGRFSPDFLRALKAEIAERRAALREGGKL